MIAITHTYRDRWLGPVTRAYPRSQIAATLRRWRHNGHWDGLRFYCRGYATPALKRQATRERVASELTLDEINRTPGV